MNVYPNLEDVLTYQEAYQSVPLSITLYADSITPMECMRKLKRVSHHCYMLESVEQSEVWGRYTFLGYDPKLELTCLNKEIHIRDGKQDRVVNQPFEEVIRELLAAYRSPKIKEFPPFTGGLVGYLSYDYIKYIEEQLVLDAPDEEGFQDVDLMLFDKVIVFDHLKQVIYCIVHMKLDDPKIRYAQASEILREMALLIQHGEASEIPALQLHSPFAAMVDQKQYCQMVERAKHYIHEGDIFQVVLSNRFCADVSGSLFDAYRVLRTTNPSPYMFYLSSDDLEIAGASPETLVKVEDDNVYTFPLAGTRKRGADQTEDYMLEQELRKDPKELAEHHMLVDLGRNDLGKICEFGSVNLTSYLNIVRFSHVMHIGSTIQGRLRNDCDAIDAVGAVLPAGTLSGAPKFRACEIINELETQKRGIYGGAIGYFAFHGDMDLCIAIRIAYKKQGKVFVRSGAGIVADSVPMNEYEECANKAKAVFQALHQAEGGIDDDFAN